MDVGNADLVGNIDRPTYMDVGNADLVGNIDRPTYMDVGNADLVGNTDRPTCRSRAFSLSAVRRSLLIHLALRIVLEANAIDEV
jgi:hypothetical protein